MKLSATQREYLSTFTALAMAARQSALEDAAAYHDDLASQHEAVGWESPHHEMMARSHRKDAAAIRALFTEAGRDIADGGAQE